MTVEVVCSFKMILQQDLLLALWTVLNPKCVIGKRRVCHRAEGLMDSGRED